MKDERPHTQLLPPNGPEDRLQELVRAKAMIWANWLTWRIIKRTLLAKVA